MTSSIDLGTAGKFAVLGANISVNFDGNVIGPPTPIFNHSFSTIKGKLGVSPGLPSGNNITGFPPGVVIGKIHNNDAVAQVAHKDLLKAYNQAVKTVATQNLSGNQNNTANTTLGSTGINLGGLILPAGVYQYNHSANLIGTLTLDGQNNPNSVWIFKIGQSQFGQFSPDGTLTTSSRTPIIGNGSIVKLINGAVGKNVFWQVGNITNIGPNSHFVGTIMSFNSIIASTNAIIQGGLLSLNGSVSLDTNIVQSNFYNDAVSK